MYLYVYFVISIIVLFVCVCGGSKFTSMSEHLCGRMCADIFGLPTGSALVEMHWEALGLKQHLGLYAACALTRPRSPFDKDHTQLGPH